MTDELRRLFAPRRYSTIESAVALLASFVVNLAVVVTFWRHYYSYADCAVRAGGPYACVAESSLSLGEEPHGTCELPDGGGAHTPGACAVLGLESAGAALSHSAGGHANLLWGLALVFAGQASTMTTTFAGQAIMDGILQAGLALLPLLPSSDDHLLSRLPSSPLQIPLRPEQRVAITRAAALGPALVVIFWSQASPGRLSVVNTALNLLQSLQLPFAMLPALHFSSSAAVMGRFASPRWLRLLSWPLALFVCAVGLTVVLSSVQLPPSMDAPVALLALGYAAVVARLALSGCLLPGEGAGGAACRLAAAAWRWCCCCTSARHVAAPHLAQPLFGAAQDL